MPGPGQCRFLWVWGHCEALAAEIELLRASLIEPCERTVEEAFGIWGITDPHFMPFFDALSAGAAEEIESRACTLNTSC